MTNLSKKIFFVAVLFTLVLGCTIFSTPFSAFADDSIPPDLGLENSFTSSSDPISAEDDLIIREASKVIADSVYSTSDVRATDYAQLIYNYLVNTIHQDLSTMNGYNQSMNTRLLNIQNSLNGGSTNNTSIYTIVKDLKNFTVGSDTTGQSVSIWKMLLAIVDAWNISDPGLNNGFLANQLSSIASNTAASSSTSNLLYSLNTLSYADITTYFQFVGICDTFDGSYTQPSSATTYPSMFLKLHLTSNITTFNGIRIRFPISYPYNQVRVIKLFVVRNNEKIEIPIEYVVNNNWVYILNTPECFGVSDLYFYFDSIPSPANVTYSPASSIALKVEVTNDGLNQKDYFADLAIIDINRKLSALDIIKNEIASPDLVEAKEKSAPTTKQALDDFTGDGSSAATTSDVSSASDISDTVSSGVDAGGAVSDALTVFNPAAAFFGWFSQDCANYFIPYQPSRNSFKDWSDVVWTDDVPDLLTNINNDVQNQIGDDK